MEKVHISGADGITNHRALITLAQEMNTVPKGYITRQELATCTKLSYKTVQGIVDQVPEKYVIRRVYKNRMCWLYKESEIIKIMQKKRALVV